MAAALDAAWPDVDLVGVVSTRYGHAVNAGRVRVIEAGHPVPDSNSERAAREMLELVTGLSATDLVVALISGGGSATMALPIAPISLKDKQSITHQLLSSGASIAEINTVRTQLSQVKGGRLAAAAAPARLATLIISDVPGDDPTFVASGPTVVPASHADNALEIIRRYAIDTPAELERILATTQPLELETGRLSTSVVATASQALDAAANECRHLDLDPLVLGDEIECESRELGRAIAGIARFVTKRDEPVRTPAVLLSGGETCVTLGSERAGRGGRNTEFALSLATALDAAPGIWALAIDTDGIDGTEDAAGAIVAPDTLARAAAAGCDAREALTNHDSYSLFRAIDDLVVTGPTLTNVNDLRVVLIT